MTYPLLKLAGAAGVGAAYATAHDAFFVVDGDGIIRYRNTNGALPRWRPEDVGPIVDQYIAQLLSGVGDAPAREGFTLGEAYPNPFNPLTRIPYRLAADGAAGMRLVDLRLMDVRGRTIRRLLTEHQPSGAEYEVAWDGRGDDGLPVASGTYLVNLTVDGAVQARFITLLK